jgi:hypothetical protein
MWVKSADTLKKVFEDSAKVAFQASKKIESCTLAYVVLGKAKLLSALHKQNVAKDANVKMVDFYARDFNDAKNKAAANKNAFVLLGKSEYLRAVGFFVLGGNLTDAVGVAIKNLSDVHLAVLLCRCIEGDEGPLLKQVVSDSLVPQLINDSEYLLASVLLWRTKRVAEAYALLFDPKTSHKLSLAKADEQPSGSGARHASFSPTWYYLLCEMRCKVEMLPHLPRCPRLRPHEVHRHLAYVLANLGATMLALEQLSVYRQQVLRRYRHADKPVASLALVLHGQLGFRCVHHVLADRLCRCLPLRNAGGKSGESSNRDRCWMGRSSSSHTGALLSVSARRLECWRVLGCTRNQSVLWGQKWPEALFDLSFSSTQSSSRCVAAWLFRSSPTASLIASTPR